MILNFVEDYFLFNCWMIYFHIWTNGWALLFTHHASGLNGFDYLILTENLKRILFGVVNLLFSNLKLNMMIWNDEPNFSRISWNLNLWNVFYAYYIFFGTCTVEQSQKTTLHPLSESGRPRPSVLSRMNRSNQFGSFSYY